jgi:hypothetical protein
VGSEIFMPNKKKNTPPPDRGHLWRLLHTAELLRWYGDGATGPFPECKAKQPSPEEREAIIAELDRITAEFVLPGLLPEGGDLHTFTTNAEADLANVTKVVKEMGGDFYKAVVVSSESR